MSAFFIFALLFGCLLLNLQYSAAREQTNETRIFTSNLDGSSLRSGDKLELYCGITNADKATVSWWRSETKLSDGNRTLTNDSRVSLRVFLDQLPFWSPVEGFTNLVIRDVRMSDAGQYKCTATPLDNPKKAVSHTQNVKVDYSILLGASKSVDIPEGESLSASCKVTGNPMPTIKWMVKDVRERKRDLPQFNGMQNITIAQMNYTDAGWYNCVVDNGTGDPFITTVVAASVIYPPKFADDQFGPNVTYAKIGSHGFLSCYFAVNPPGAYTVKWFRKQSLPAKSGDRTEIVAGDQYQIESSYYQAYRHISVNLGIKNVQEGDLGKYVCTAKNERGSAEGEVELRKQS